ncbi:MAG: DNA excision repair protein ERCC-2 [Kiritimatiellia bacterium]|jgi:DNA excision repair protein ERCC-2
MAFRFDDVERIVSCSVRDVVERGFASGHLSLEVVQSGRARMAQGRDVHLAWQKERADADSTFEAERTLRHQLVVGDWTVRIMGRLDGLSREGDRDVVEEVKSAALDHARLFDTSPEDWPTYVAQLQVYVWMMVRGRRPDPIARLVLVSLVDGSRHVLGVPCDVQTIESRVVGWLSLVVSEREARVRWMHKRRGYEVPAPFDDWRVGQATLTDQVQSSLDSGRALLAEAPTGLGKTAAVLHGALIHALREGRQVFWATARGTQQQAALQACVQLTERGLPLRVVHITARGKACLNDVIACRPESCAFAYLHHDKVHNNDVIGRVLEEGVADRECFRRHGLEYEVCPYQLASEAARRADVVIGDYNYAFDPDVGGKKLFGEQAERWVVVVDEVHQLVERIRGYLSPAVSVSLAKRAASRMLSVNKVTYARFVEICDDVLHLFHEAVQVTEGPWNRGEAKFEPDLRRWQDLADAIDEVGLDYAMLSEVQPISERGEFDPWRELAWSVLRFVAALEVRGDETVCLVCRSGAQAGVRLLCLDPGPIAGPRLSAYGGLVGCSATISPLEFYRDLLGLHPDALDHLSLPSPFPASNLKVIVAPRISTAFKDREAHAARLSELLAQCALATPGNIAFYFPSFAMLQSVMPLVQLTGRTLLSQTRDMDVQTRAEWLDRLRDGERDVVLAAVLGGVFAEGIDLPGGALQGVVVVGPGLPGVGLERDLLRQWYEERYDAGFLYASLVPGMTRVVQAAGRLVRGPTDRGVVVLVGRRFRWRDYSPLLPESWNVSVPDDPVLAIAEFWDGGAGADTVIDR